MQWSSAVYIIVMGSDFPFFIVCAASRVLAFLASSFEVSEWSLGEGVFAGVRCWRRGEFVGE